MMDIFFHQKLILLSQEKLKKINYVYCLNNSKRERKINKEIIKRKYLQHHKEPVELEKREANCKQGNKGPEDHHQGQRYSRH